MGWAGAREGEVEGAGKGKGRRGRGRRRQRQRPQAKAKAEGEGKGEGEGRCMCRHLHRKPLHDLQVLSFARLKIATASDLDTASGNLATAPGDVGAKSEGTASVAEAAGQLEAHPVPAATPPLLLANRLEVRWAPLCNMLFFLINRTSTAPSPPSAGALGAIVQYFSLYDKAAPPLLLANRLQVACP